MQMQMQMETRETVAGCLMALDCMEVERPHLDYCGQQVTSPTPSRAAGLC